MPQSLKKFSPAIFGIALVCFVLPWVSFSCQGQHIATLTGLQLVTGTTIQQQGVFGGGKSQKVGSEPLAIIVLALTVLGIAVSFGTKKEESLIPSIVGALSLILLIWLKVKIDIDAASQNQGIIQVEYGIGYWLILILFFGAIVLNGFLYFDSKKEIQTVPSQT